MIKCASLITAILGNVTDIDEDNTFMNYSVIVLRILKQGSKELERKTKISFRKRIDCIYPNLEINNAVFIMGRDKDGTYQLDQHSFVKILENKKDKRTIRRLARKVKRNKCDPD